MNEISIPCIYTQHFPDSPSYTPLHSYHRPQQRLFNPMKHQQGTWTKDRLKHFILYNHHRHPPSHHHHLLLLQLLPIVILLTIYHHQSIPIKR